MVGNNKRKTILLILSIILIVFLCVYMFIIYNGYKLAGYYKNRVLPETYIGNYNISKMKIKNIKNKVLKIEEELQSKKINFKTNGSVYEYSLKDLNISIDNEKMLNEIKKYEDDLSYSEKVNIIFSKKKKVFSYKVNYNETDIKTFITNLKTIVDKTGSDGKIIMDQNRSLTYQEAISSYNLDVTKSTSKVLEYFKGGFNNLEIELVGEGNNYKDNEQLKTIDTKVSTFSTNYNRYISRGKNLEAALNYLDGTIINSGEVFSYFNVAGPYHKKGYVYYDKMIGNGVCQIASTIYNTALIGGLTITERHQHQQLLPYVLGGQDATVVSNGNYNALDFKFKNTYKYPIYISAFYNNGVATVEFWSNSNAKEGKTYTVESVALGNMTYQTYLHTIKDGVELEKTAIAKTHYTK